jgi:hypothetical protein
VIEFKRNVYQMALTELSRFLPEAGFQKDVNSHQTKNMIGTNPAP